MEWFEDEGVDVTAAFQGFTAPVQELVGEIEGRGWNVTKVKINTDGQYEAEIKNPYGERITKTGPTDNTALGNALIALMRRETIRYQARTASWNSDWRDQLHDIAQAYAKAPMYDPKAALAWKELGDYMSSTANHIKQKLDVEYTNDPTPYLTFDDMVNDVKKKEHIYVTRHNATHPMWSSQQVLDYRLVRDVLGHCVGGGDFGWLGENRATAAMMPMLSPNAQKALFTESIGQTAFNNHYQQFGPQKITFLDDHLEDVQNKENEPGQAATHPSQLILPGQLPSVTKEASLDRDPNDGYSPNIAPLPDNAYLWQRENGVDPIDSQGLSDLADRLDTRWYHLKHPDGHPDFETQRQAVSNAVKAVLMAPRKNLRWQATHYQHLSPLAPTVSDPMRYYEALETHRDHHNTARGMEPGIHKIWKAEEPAFLGWVKSNYPGLNDHELHQIAKSEIFHMLAEEEQRLALDDADHRLSAWELEEAAGKALQKRLKALTKPNSNEKTDFANLVANIMNQPDPGVYGPYLASPLKTMAAVHRHIDDLTQAAREDVDKGGHGHHFRHAVLSRHIPGFGAKEASHAWFLLQPKTSQLAVINPEISEALGHRPEETNRRDYFKHERELMAGRDAAGYSHIPLGLFGVGMWDYRRGGNGYHGDYDTQRVLNPRPHDQTDWANHETKDVGRWPKPYWWESTQDARNMAADEWDAQIAPTVPAHQIPFQKAASALPWFVHNGERHEGQPGQTLIQAMRGGTGLTTEEIWKLIAEAGKNGIPPTESMNEPTARENQLHHLEGRNLL